MTMILTRADLLAKSKQKPLHKLGWKDLRGTMRSFSEADVVVVIDEGKARIMKDRQGDYLSLPKDDVGLVSAADLQRAVMS